MGGLVIEWDIKRVLKEIIRISKRLDQLGELKELSDYLTTPQAPFGLLSSPHYNSSFAILSSLTIFLY